MADRRARRLPNLSERLGQVDRTNLAIAIAAVTLVLAIIFPRIYPAARNGPQCSDLASPIGGNNRSMLAQAGGDQQNLDLQLHLDNTAITSGSSLKLNVTFVNNDIGPVILYLPNNGTPAIFRPDQNQTSPGTGITFEITQVGSQYTQTAQGVIPVASSWVNPEELHLLGSRSRCTESVTFTSDLLTTYGIYPGGEYRIRVYYSNANTGTQRPQVLGLPTQTATPAYFDQGIWTGQISSGETLFRINQ